MEESGQFETGAPKDDSAAAYRPDFPAEANVAEFSIKAAVMGTVLGILFAAANAYIGLKAGVTVSASIPVAVASVAIFSVMRAFRAKRATMLETNISQSIGSAGESLAAGVIFTIPALIIWGMNPSWLSISLYAGIGGILGVLFMIPLRRFLIKQEHGNLPYPEGTACAQVIRAADRGGHLARHVFSGLGIAAVYEFLRSGLGLWKGTASFNLPAIRNAVVSCTLSPAYLGVGYILGFRISTIMVGGGAISALLLIPIISRWGMGLDHPLYPETQLLIRDMTAAQIWNRYIRYIGAGAVAFGGIVTLIRSIPTIVASFKLGLRGMTAAGKEAVDRLDQDLSMRLVLIGSAVLILFMWLSPMVPVNFVGALLLAVFAFFFVTVSSRIVGLVGTTSNPVSGMTIATLLGTSMIFVVTGMANAPGAKISVLLIGAIVAMAAAIAGDTSQDLKTGFLLGATPWKQQAGELLGVLTSMMLIGGTVLLLHKAYVIGSAQLPAPQATLMSLVVDGVIDRNLPWTLVFIGAGIALVFELFRIPSLPMAVGLYLPLATTMPIFIGGVIHKAMKHTASGESGDDPGVLFGSGMVGGEGLVGVLLALMLVAPATQALSERMQTVGGSWWTPIGAWGDLLSVAIFAVLIVLLVRTAKARAHA